MFHHGNYAAKRNYSINIVVSFKDNIDHLK